MPMLQHFGKTSQRLWPNYSLSVPELQERVDNDDFKEEGDRMKDITPELLDELKF